MENSHTKYNIHTLIREFSDIMQSYEAEDSVKTQGDKPVFPVLFVSVGAQEEDLFPEMQKRLSSLWPGYRSDIRYLAADGAEDGLLLHNVNRRGEREPISERELMDLLDALRGNGAKYEDFSRFFAYFVIDSNFFASAEDFLKALSVIDRIKAVIGAQKVQEHIVLLLSESTKNRETAKALRSMIFEMQNDPDRKRSILILSNYLKDQSFLESRTLLYNSVLDFIALSDRENSYENLLNRATVKTVGIIREDKPLTEISSVVLKTMLEYLKSAERGEEFTLTKDMIGLNENGTYQIFEDYAKKKVPGIEDLDVFPRPEPDYLEMETLSYKEFNIQTLNSWDGALNSIVSHVKEEVAYSDDFMGDFGSKYKTLLRKNMPNDCLRQLPRLRSKIKAYLEDLQEPSDSQPVLDVSLWKVGYLIASDPHVRDTMLSAILKEGITADEFMRGWEALYESRYELRPVTDAGIQEFYATRTRHLCLLNGIEESFRDIYDAEELHTFLVKTFRAFTEQEEAFRLSFEKELQARMDELGNKENVRDAIRDSLVHEKATEFLTTSLPLSMPVSSTIFIEQDSELQKALSLRLPQEYDYRFYNTGTDRYCEAVYVYEVPQDYLLN